MSLRTLSDALNVTLEPTCRLHIDLFQGLHRNSTIPGLHAK